MVGGEFRVRVWGSKQEETEVGGVVFRVLGIAQRCIDFEESFIVVLVGWSSVVCTKLLTCPRRRRRRRRTRKIC